MKIPFRKMLLVIGNSVLAGASATMDIVQCAGIIILLVPLSFVISNAILTVFGVQGSFLTNYFGAVIIFYLAHRRFLI